MSHSLVFFLLHLLPLSVFFFFFFINNVENSVLKQLETGSSSSGNKSLSFRTVSLQHRGGYRPGTTTKKKKKGPEGLKKKMAIYHIAHINKRFVFVCKEEYTVFCSFVVFHHQNIYISLFCIVKEPSPSPKGVFKNGAKKMAVVNIPLPHKPAHMKSVTSVFGKSIAPLKDFHAYSFM